MRHAHVIPRGATPTQAPVGPVAIVALVCATLSWSCSAPTVPRQRGPEGHWTLVAVDGAPLPATIRQGTQIVGGDLELSVDGTFWRSTRTASAGSTTEDRDEGSWAVGGVTGDRIEFTGRDGAAAVLALRRADTIEIPRGRGRPVLHYERGPATSRTTVAP